MKYTFLLFISIWTSHLSAQNTDTLHLSFVPTYENKPLQIGEEATQINDSLAIEAFKFYATNIALYNAETRVLVAKESYHLINAEAKTNNTITLTIPANTDFSQVQFNIGVDSLTNIAGVFGGDLDPTNGMYWTWQSGYINFKLEGTSSICPTRNNRFQFHLGGYAFPNNTLQTVRLDIPKKEKTDTIIIEVAIDAFLNNINLAEQNQVMALGEEAMELAKQVPAIFSIGVE